MLLSKRSRVPARDKAVRVQLRANHRAKDTVMEDTAMILRKHLKVLWREKKGENSENPIWESRIPSVCSEQQMGKSELCFRMFPNKPLSLCRALRVLSHSALLTTPLGMMLRFQRRHDQDGRHVHTK